MKEFLHMPKGLFLLLALLAPWAAKAQTTVTIGTGDHDSAMYPFQLGRNYSVIQMVYPASAIGAAGAIQSIAYDYNGQGDFTMEGLQVYMKNVSTTNIYSVSEMVQVSESDRVFNGTFSVSGAGWNTLTLDTPFFYDGTSNLLVCIYDPTLGYPGNQTKRFYCTYPATYRSCSIYDNNVCPDINNLSSWSGDFDDQPIIPNIRLEITPTVTVGNGNYDTDHLPLEMDYLYALTQQIYTGNEIGMVGEIQSISFYYNYDAPIDIPDVQVYMKNTTKSKFNHNTDMVPVSDADKVYDGYVTASGPGWVTLQLDTPFHYDGSNLLVCVYKLNDSWGDDFKFRATQYNSNKDCSISYYSWSAIPDINNINVYSGNKAVLDYRNNIKLAISENITFADPNVKQICVQNWDTNGDGELSYAEAAAVTSLGETFRNAFQEGGTSITFNELQYFTGLTNIDEHAFSGCWRLTSITIPNTVTSIGDCAFSMCNLLASLTIPTSVQSIGALAFLYCHSLTTIEIPNSITTIDQGAFDHCFSLTSIAIPASVTDIGLNPFDNCTSLASITVDENNPVYSSPNGCNAIIHTANHTLVSGCMNTIIPDDITTIETAAFRGCTFSSIEIPASVTAIGLYAFQTCSALTSMTVLAETPPTIYESFLNVPTDIPVYVPCGAVEAYQTYDNGAPWGGFTNLRSVNENFPWTEDFESYTGLNNNNTYYNTMPQCWNSIHGANPSQHYYDRFPTIYNNSSYAHSGSKFLFLVDNYDTNYTHSDQYVILPMMENVNQLTLSFFVRKDARDPYFEVGVMTDPEDASTFTMVSSATPNSTTYTYYTFSFDSYTGTGTYIAIKMPAASNGHNRAVMIDDVTVNSANIVFADATVKQICVANWDTNNDGELSYAEAAAVTTLTPDGVMNSVFYNTNITSFDELQYFTGLTSIGEFAFYGCLNLNSVVFPDNLTSIKSLAFSSCGLISVEIPASVTSILQNPFSECANLSSITVNENNTVYSSPNNCNAIVRTSTHELISGCKNSVIPDDIVSINASAFSRCTDLTSITIPASVNNIGSNAFYNCLGLTEMTVLATTPPTLGISVYSNVPSNIPVYVPCESVEAYQTYDNGEPWGGFTNFQCHPYEDFPYVNDFETSCGWRLINGDLTNQWVWGEASTRNNHYLYISNNGGISNQYTITSSTMVYATKLFHFEEGGYRFQYDWLAYGEKNWDYLRVALVPASVELSASTSVPSGFSYQGLPTGWIALDGGAQLNQNTWWQTTISEIEVPTGDYLMVFAWRNDNSVGTQPPAAIDNVSITPITCLAPAELTAQYVGATQVILDWIPSGNEDEWQVWLSWENGNETLYVPYTANTHPFTLTGLTAGRTYTANVYALCGPDDASMPSNEISFTTSTNPCDDPISLPFTENFDGYTGSTSPSVNVLPDCWSRINTTTASYYSGYPRVTEFSSYAHSGPNFLYFMSNYDSDPQDQYAILPPVDHTANLVLSLYARIPAAGRNGTFMVGVMTDPSDASTFTELASYQPTSTTYTYYSIPLGLYTGDGTYIAIKMPAASSEVNYRGVCIDDIAIEPLCNPEDQCNLTFTLTDSYGDGWNGNAINVVDVETGVILASMTNVTNDHANAPITETYTLPVCDGRELRFEWVKGNWATECSYTITNANGEVILQGTGSDSMNTGDELGTYSVNCNAIAQTIALTAGWNWVSTYIDANEVDCLAMLEEALGDYGVSIATSNDIAEYLGDGFWLGLEGYQWTNSEMIMVEVNADCTVSLEGPAVDPGTFSITINPGWNWIGFPFDSERSIEDALASFEPELGDGIASYEGITEYIGIWTGDFETLVPGQGYMYYSASEEPKVLSFIQHEYVDLGLPSGLLWATCNVGATAPEDFGDYFAWGETQPKNIYDWTTYQYYNGNILTKYTGSDGLTILEPCDDAAAANWGSGWRMPTEEELQELYDNTTHVWTTQNGVYGRLFTASNGNSLFLPAAGYRYDSTLYIVGDHGYYWSSSLYSDSYNAWGTYLGSGDYGTGNSVRSSGFNVRPVCSSGQK